MEGLRNPAASEASSLQGLQLLVASTHRLAGHAYAHNGATPHQAQATAAALKQQQQEQQPQEGLPAGTWEQQLGVGRTSSLDVQQRQRTSASSPRPSDGQDAGSQENEAAQALGEWLSLNEGLECTSFMSYQGLTVRAAIHAWHCVCLQKKSHFTMMFMQCQWPSN